MSKQRTAPSPAKSLFSSNLLPLPTPSLSPSASRSFFSSPGPSPSKKRRFASTVSSNSLSVSTPRSSLSLSRLDPVDDLHDARRASSLRVLDIWSSLAARYNRRLDEDDIVDLRTGNVIKDRGVLRDLPHQFKIGHFADADDPLHSIDASSERDDAPTEAEDDVDEIDAFAPENDIPKGLKLKSIVVPPVQVRNPADADDLREFMEAERLRKELDGDDNVDDDDEDSEDDIAVSLHEHSNPSSSCGSLDPTRSDGHQVASQDASGNSECLWDDDTSEDEFAAWDIDEGNTLYQIVSEPDDEPQHPSPQSASLSLPPSPSLTRSLSCKDRASVSPKVTNESPKRDIAKALNRVQLHTPPQSKTSVLDFTLDDIDVQFPPPQIRPRSKSVRDCMPASLSPTHSHSDSGSPPKLIKPKKSTKPRQRLIPIVAIPRVSPGTLQGGSTDGSRICSRRKPRGNDTNQTVVSAPDARDPPGLEDSMSSSQDHDSLPKQGRKSTGPDVRSRQKYYSSSARSSKRKRTVSISEDDVPDVNRGKTRLASTNNGDEAHDESSEDSDAAARRSPSKSQSTHRFQSTHPTVNSYPFFTPYTPQYRHSSQYPPPMFQPIQDSTAQFIIAQAMHQLARLVTAPQPSANGSVSWSSSPMPGPSYPPYPVPDHYPTWPPITPNHDRHLDTNPTTEDGEPGYQTPTSQVYPYPYMLTPSLSRSTLPPSSPVESSSSPAKSMSRGLRVSFESPPSSARSRRKNTRSSAGRRRGQQRTAPVECSEGEEDGSSPGRRRVDGRL